MLAISGHLHRIRRFVSLLFLVGAFVASSKLLTVWARSQSSKVKAVQASSDQPLWRNDLQSLGYPASEPELQGRRSPVVFRTIDFLSDTVVAATFVT
jgi:hypothetical protein